MTDATAQSVSAPLGVGQIISDSFSILFGKFFKVMILGFTGAFLGYLINGAFLGFNVALGLEDPSFVDPTLAIVSTVVSTLIGLIVYGLITALLVQLAYDTKLGRNRSLLAYFGPALKAMVPIALLSIVAGILTSLGAIALLIGALWVYAVFCVMAPSVVIENAGFGGLGRSAALTKGYRWPIVGTLIILFICTILIMLAVGFIIGMLVAAVGDGVAGIIVLGIVWALFNGIVYGLGGISLALIYARLREIKEGVGVDEIASVFD